MVIMAEPKNLGSELQSTGEGNSSISTNNTNADAIADSRTSRSEHLNHEAEVPPNSIPMNILHKSSSAGALEISVEKELLTRFGKPGKRASAESLAKMTTEAASTPSIFQQQGILDTVPNKLKRQRAPTITIDTSAVAAEPRKNANSSAVVAGGGESAHIESLCSSSEVPPPTTEGAHLSGAGSIFAKSLQPDGFSAPQPIPESQSGGQSNRSRSNSAPDVPTVTTGIIAGSVAGWSPLERSATETDVSHNESAPTTKAPQPSGLLQVPGLERQLLVDRPPNDELLNPSDVYEPSPSPSELESGNRLLRRFQRKRVQPEHATRTSDDRPPSNESAQTKRKRFLSRFRDDSQSPRRDLMRCNPFTIRNQLQRTIFNSWINVLLLFAPVGIALNYIPTSPVLIFVTNLLAIIPLLALSSFAVEELSLRTGETLGTLLSVVFGTAGHLIIGVLALVRGNILFLQSFLMGSLIEPLLLRLGLCFFFGGLRRIEQYFNQKPAQTASSTLNGAVASILIPTFVTLSAEAPLSGAKTSRGTAIILLALYIAFLYQEICAGKINVFNEASREVSMRPRKHRLPEGSISHGLAKAGGIGHRAAISKETRARAREKAEDAKGDADETFETTPVVDDDGDDNDEEPMLNVYVALFTLVISTALTVLCSMFLVNSIESVTSKGHVRTEFIGLVLLPLVIGMCDTMTAVTVACKDKMDLALAVAIGSCIQVALLVIPITVLVGWMTGEEKMTLVFDSFPTVILIIAAYMVNNAVGDGSSTWWAGAQFMGFFVIFALCTWFFEDTLKP